MSTNGKQKERTTTPGGIPKNGWWFIAIFAVLIFIGFGFLIAYMAKKAGSTSTNEWDNLVFLFTSVEAIALAIVAFFFGREINRESARTNAQRADEAQNQRVAAEKDKALAEQEAKILKEKGQKADNKLQQLDTEVHAARGETPSNIGDRIREIRALLN